MRTRSVLAVVTGGIALAAAPTSAHSAETAYPIRPIRIIVPFPPGGSADPLGRAFANWFADKFGVPVIADNRPGAGTAIAHTIGAKAAPDGYTLTLGASSGLTTNPALGTKLDYDPVKDFAPVSLAAYVPQLLVVFPAVPAKNVAELIEIGKTPGRVNFGSPGFGSVGHLSMELINVTTGSKFSHVPYKGVGPALIDLIANRIQALFGSVTGNQPHVAAGRVRALATGHTRRVQSMPDVPTVAETLPGFTNNGWYAIFAPANTPQSIIAKLNAEMKNALANAQFAKHIETIGMEPNGSTPEELGSWLRGELERWTKVVRDAGVPPPKH